MSQVNVQKVKDPGASPPPVLEQLAKQIENVRRRAYDLFEGRGCEMGRAVEDWLTAEREVCGWPAAELCEKDGAFELQVALPGYDAKEVEVTVTGEEAIIHAATHQQKKEEKKTEKGDVVWTEYGSNDVTRRICWPKAVVVDKAAARLEKGILRITVPLAVPPKEKQITVMAA